MIELMCWIPTCTIGPPSPRIAARARSDAQGSDVRELALQLGWQWHAAHRTQLGPPRPLQSGRSGHPDRVVHLPLLEDVDQRIGALCAARRDRGHSNTRGGRIAASVQPRQRRGDLREFEALLVTRGDGRAVVAAVAAEVSRVRERCADLLYDDAVRSAQARDPPLDCLPDRIGARLLRRDILGWVLWHSYRLLLCLRVP